MKEFPKLFELIFDSWLPSPEYKQKDNQIVEIYHLWTDYELRNKNRYYEVWLPIEKNSDSAITVEHFSYQRQK